MRVWGLRCGDWVLGGEGWNEMGFGCGTSELRMWGWGLGIGVWSVLGLAQLQFEAVSIYLSFNRSIDLSIYLSIYPSIYTKICIHRKTVLFSNTLVLS